MKALVLALVGLSIFLFFAPVLPQRDVRSYTWQVKIPATFPTFFSSNPTYDLLLNDLLYLFKTVLHEAK